MRRSSAPLAGILGAALVIALSASPVHAAPAYVAELTVDEVGFRSGLRIRLFHEPGWVPMPAGAGHLVLLAADSGRGDASFFLPNDLAVELGGRQVYRFEFEQTSDLFGQPLGGRLREGEVQYGFAILPALLDFDAFFPAQPESVAVRYAHHRARFRRATEEERVEWETQLAKPRLIAGMNAWWAWNENVSSAPPMSEGEIRHFAERIFPGQGEILAEESLDADALRNAILRVGERRLLFAPALHRVAPRYPIAARQAGMEGLVVVLAYVDANGDVADATVLSSNTVHLLNLSAVEAAMEWRFLSATGVVEGGDGWRLLPFQFRLTEPAPAIAETPAPPTGPVGEATPPRLLKRVEPEYPEKAYRSRIEGTVIYRVRVDARGKLVSTRLVQGVHPLLDEAALVAVERCLYAPGSRDGAPVDGELDLSFTFGESKKR